MVAAAVPRLEKFNNENNHILFCEGTAENWLECQLLENRYLYKEGGNVCLRAKSLKKDILQWGCAEKLKKELRQAAREQ